MYFVILNSYFQTDDFSENPIKEYYKPYELTTFSSTVSSNYFLQLSLNYAILNDGMFISNQRNLTFVETRMDYPYFQPVKAPISEPMNNAYISIYIVMDSNVKIINRDVYNIFDMMSVVGGFMSVAFIIGLIFVSYF